MIVYLVSWSLLSCKLSIYFVIRFSVPRSFFSLLVLSLIRAGDSTESRHTVAITCELSSNKARKRVLRLLLLQLLHLRNGWLSVQRLISTALPWEVPTPPIIGRRKGPPCYHQRLKDSTLATSLFLTSDQLMLGSISALQRINTVSLTPERLGCTSKV